MYSLHSKLFNIFGPLDTLSLTCLVSSLQPGIVPQRGGGGCLYTQPKTILLRE